MRTKLVTILMMPFYFSYCYGIHVASGVAALITTIYAVFSEELLNMAAHGRAAPGAEIIITLDRLGWWKIAGVMWIYTIITIYIYSLHKNINQNY